MMMLMMKVSQMQNVIDEYDDDDYDDHNTSGW